MHSRADLSQTRIIKRYQNRKLYDTVQSCYVVLGEIADLFKLNQKIEIIDNKTKQDITYNTQIQVLFDAEKKSSLGSDVELMNRIIRSEEGTFTGYIRNLQGLPAAKEVGPFSFEAQEVEHQDHLSHDLRQSRRLV